MWIVKNTTDITLLHILYLQTTSVSVGALKVYKRGCKNEQYESKDCSFYKENTCQSAGENSDESVQITVCI